MVSIFLTSLFCYIKTVKNNKEMSESSKDLFFFSKFCEYSNSMLSVISKKGIQKNFHFVCIDNKSRSQLPPFVDRVPLIYTTRKDVLSDEFVSNYIETRYPSPSMKGMQLPEQAGQNSSASTPQNQDDGITPFMLGNALNSSQYTYITPDGNGYESSFDINGEMIHKNNFGMIGQDQVISGGVPRSSDFNDKSTEKSEKFDSKLFEKMMESRTHDDDILKKKIMQGNNGF